MAFMSWLPETGLSLAVVVIVAAAAWFNLPVAAWAPALIAALGVIYTRMSAREQVRVAERKLFLDLMQRRIEWVGKLNVAVSARHAEAALMLERLLSNEAMGEPTQLWRIHECQREAVWLFGPPMPALVGKLIGALDVIDSVRLEARQGDRNAAMSVGEKASAVLDVVGQINEAVRPYLYVGDIKAPQR
jgi:hypothetical protein